MAVDGVGVVLFSWLKGGVCGEEDREWKWQLYKWDLENGFVLGKGLKKLSAYTAQHGKFSKNSVFGGFHHHHVTLRHVLLGKMAAASKRMMELISILCQIF